MSSNPGTLHYQDAHLRVDDKGVVWLEGQILPLTNKERQLLLMLIQHADEIVPRDTLFMSIWGYQEGVKSRTLDIHIYRLRKHLRGFANTYIETIFGKGYCFHSRAGTESSNDHDHRRFARSRIISTVFSPSH